MRINKDEEFVSRSDALDAFGHGSVYTSEDAQRIVRRLPAMTNKEAYKIVFDDLTREDGCALFRGVYDAKNGKTSYMYGISHVMEYIAIQVSEQTRDNFEEMFLKNMIKSEEKAERVKTNT